MTTDSTTEPFQGFLKILFGGYYISSARIEGEIHSNDQAQEKYTEFYEAKLAPIEKEIFERIAAEKAKEDEKKRLEAEARRLEAQKRAEEKRRRKLYVGTVRVNAGTEYVHYSDGSCLEKEGRVCLSKDDYQKFCSRTVLASQAALRMVGITDTRYSKLLQNGVKPTFAIKWAGSGNDGGCRLQASANGTLQGNTVSVSLNGIITTFGVSKDLTTFAKSASSF